MAILSNLYTKSNNYGYTLTLAGIVPVKGYYQTTLTGTHFIRGEKIEAVKTKITDTPRMVITWPKPKRATKYQLTLQGLVETQRVAQVQPIKLVGTKTVGVKKAPVLVFVAPLNATTAVIATEQNADPAKSSSSDDGGESGEEPDHEDALKRLISQLKYDLALDLEEELEEEEAEQEEQIDWVEDAEIQTTKTSNNGLVKPKATTPLFDNTPQYLQDKKHWLLWEYMFNEGRWTKVPLQCNKSHAKTNDPTTWASFEEVKTAYLSGGFDGVGIAFADDGTTGVDIDKCFTVVHGEKVWDETKKQYVEEILNAFQGKAYFELSPSKTGFHIICNGKALRSGKAQRVINGAKANWIELYTYPSSRYFTFTGDVATDLTGAPLDCQADLDWLDKTYMTMPKAAKNAGASNNNLDAAHTTEDLLSVIGNPTNGTSYLFNYGLSVKKVNDLTNEFKVDRCLWQTTNSSTGVELKVGDVFRCKEKLTINKDKLIGDHSSVDLALCSRLAFFTNRNAQQMDDLFRLSCLMRPKWDELRGSYTYGNITIQKAIREAVENNAEVYKNGKPKIELVDPTLFNTAATDIPNIDLNNFAFSGFSSVDTEDGASVGATVPNDNKIRFSTDKYGARLASRNNLYKAFSNPSFCGVHIKYDEFKQEPKWRFESDEVWRDMLNTSYTAMLVHLTANHKFKDAASAVGREVIDLVADENRFDSAIDWINSIHWDGKERVKDFHTAYVDISEEHTDDDDNETITDVAAYGRAVAEYMFTAMAGRVLVPDVKADMAPVYVSDEGFKKSSLVLALSPEPHMYVNISFASATVADIVRNTRGRVVAELAELEGFNKKSGEEVKNFMTSTGDTFAEKYEKRATVNQRRFIFIGTTNEKQFMVNSIGKRRWLPMTVKNINIEAIRNDIEQLWAEGAVLFKKNGVMYEAAEKLARFEHGKYTGDHCWAFPIFDYLLKCVKGDLPIYATAVLNGIGIFTEHFDQRKINEVAKVLTSLGCVSGKRKSINGVKVQTWVITPQLKKRIDDEIDKNQPQSKPMPAHESINDMLKDWDKE
jgi:hypothetical protein